MASLYSLADLEYMFYAALRNGTIGTIGAKGDPGGLTAGTPLTSADLNTITADGVYVQQDGSLPSLARNYPGTGNKPGVMYVHQRTPSSIIQVFKSRAYVSNVNMTTLTYERWSNDSGATWAPWRATVPNRVDQTAGRAIYQYDDMNDREQLIYGDTGWRDVAADTNWTNVFTTASLTVNALRVRRINYDVHIRLGYTRTASGREFGGVALPAGFDFDGSAIDAPYLGSDSTLALTRFALRSASTVVIDSTATSANASVYFTFRTASAWPTVLPGTASGSIPNA